MGRMSNRDRIARAAAEARATAKERDEQQKAKAAAPPSSGRRKKVEPVGPLKVVWEVRGPNGKTVKTYPYPLKAAAEAEAKRLTEEHDTTHYVAQAKVPL